MELGLTPWTDGKKKLGTRSDPLDGWGVTGVPGSDTSDPSNATARPHRKSLDRNAGTTDGRSLLKWVPIAIDVVYFLYFRYLQGIHILGTSESGHDSREGHSQILTRNRR